MNNSQPVEEVEDAGENYNPEEEITADGNYKIIDLKSVEMGTGEENQELVYNCAVKLYRFEKKEWQERAVGDFRFLKDKVSKKGRAILRQNTTNKLMANFYVWGEKMCQLKPHETIKGAFIWSCIDFSDIDVDQKLTTFLARFKTPEESDKFKESMEKLYLENQELDWVVKKPEEATEEKKADE